MCEPCRSVKWVAVTRTCSNLHWVEVHQISGFWGGSLLELVLYRRWLVDQLLLGFAHIVYTRKGKRVTSEYWIVSRVSVRWSSTSTIRTLMAWRSNIPQKSFLFERLSIPSLEWFVFYMQMAISTTGRRPLCIFCSVSVLSKMLKLRSAEGSSFRLWWLLSVFCCWSSLLDAVSFLLLRQHLGARHQTHLFVGIC